MVEKWGERAKEYTQHKEEKPSKPTCLVMKKPRMETSMQKILSLMMMLRRKLAPGILLQPTARPRPRQNHLQGAGYHYF